MNIRMHKYFRLYGAVGCLAVWLLFAGGRPGAAADYGAIANSAIANGDAAMAQMNALVSTQKKLLEQVTQSQNTMLQNAAARAAKENTLPSPLPGAAGSQRDNDKGPVGSRVDGPTVWNVNVGKYDTVDIFAQNAPISSLLQEIAVKSHRNIILAAGADRVVSVALYSVPLFDALTVMLDVNGLGFVEEDDFIKVFTKEQLRERALGKNGMESRFFRLNYMRAKDAADSVKTLLSPLGKVGVVKDDEEENSQEEKTSVKEMKTKADTLYKPEKQDFVFAAGITVYDYHDNVEAIAKLLAQLDQRPRQVLVEATILSVVLKDNNALGVDFSMLSRTSGLKFFDMGDSGLPTQNGTFHGGIISSDTTDASGKSTSLRAGFSIYNVGMFVTALNQITDLSVIARPKVLTLDRQRAKVLIGKNTGYTENTMENGTVSQSIKFLETGISLDVRSYILEDGKIRLTANPKISDVSFTEQPAMGGLVQKVPTENVQSLIVDILLQPGNTAVIGGLFIESNSHSSSQVPGIGDLPVIGHAARRRSEETQRQELIFLLTPTILSDQELDDIGQTTVAHTDKVLSGERQGLLPWSRVRHCEQLQLRARRFLANQQNGLGEWTYRRSLHLGGDKCDGLSDPIQPAISTHGILEKDIRDRVGRGAGAAGQQYIISSPAAGSAAAMPELRDCPDCESALPQPAGAPMPELWD